MCEESKHSRSIQRSEAATRRDVTDKQGVTSDRARGASDVYLQRGDDTGERLLDGVPSGDVSGAVDERVGGPDGDAAAADVTAIMSQQHNNTVNNSHAVTTSLTSTESSFDSDASSQYMDMYMYVCCNATATR